MFNLNTRALWILAFIVLLGSLFRLWGIGSAELTFDEGLYAFRSIGYLDYLESAAQPTPIQHFTDTALPFWTKLSFHDHPPLFFLIQHFFFALFGDTLFIARLPSALAGIASIGLIFLITKTLFKKFSLENRTDAFFNIPLPEWAGIIAALLLSTNFAHIWISRLSMMESVLFFFLFLNLYFFLQFLNNRKYWVAFGITLGLCFLTKYVSIFLIPTYLVFLVINNRTLLFNKYLYLSLLLTAILFSPVLIYNFYLYQTLGHFDLQFSYLFQQSTPEWHGTSGKTQEPFSNLKENLLILYSIPFLLFASTGILHALANLFRRTYLSHVPTAWLIVLLAFSITLLLMVIGSALRFSTLYILPGIFAITWLMTYYQSNTPKIRIACILFFAGFLVYEIIFSVQNIFLTAPKYGVVQLDQYLDSIFRNNRPHAIPHHPNPNLDAVIQSYSARYSATLPPSGIIYDDNLATPPLLWLFSRRQYYHGIPIMPASIFRQTLQSQGSNALKNFKLYFVQTGPDAPKRVSRYADGEYIETMLRKSNVAPTIIFSGNNNQPAFILYEFSI